MTTGAPIVDPITNTDPKNGEVTGLVNTSWANWFRQVSSLISEFSELVVKSVTVTDLTPNRIVSTDSDKMLVSVDDLTSWISGTALEVEVTDNGDGTVTIGLPDDVSITNDLNVLNNLNVSGNTIVGDELTVSNDSNLNGDVYIKADQKLYFDNN